MSLFFFVSGRTVLRELKYYTLIAIGSALGRFECRHRCGRKTGTSWAPFLIDWVIFSKCMSTWISLAKTIYLRRACRPLGALSSNHHASGICSLAVAEICVIKTKQPMAMVWCCTTEVHTFHTPPCVLSHIVVQCETYWRKITWIELFSKDERCTRLGR